MTSVTKIVQIDPDQVSYIQARAEMSPALIEEYAAMMADGVQFEPAEGLQDDSGQVVIWDGGHRTEAARQVRQLLTVRLRPGQRGEAEWLALSANQKHGLRRSRADKQRAVQQALRHPQGAGLSDREIARHCGVDHKTVGRMRGEMEAAGEIPRITARTVTRDGVTYRQDVSKLNNFAPVETLVQSLATILAAEPPAGALQRLVEINRQSPQGQADLAALAAHLPTPHRPRDLAAACQTVLTRLRGQVGQTGQRPVCGEAVDRADEFGALACTGCEENWPVAAANSDKPDRPHLVEAGAAEEEHQTVTQLTPLSLTAAGQTGSSDRPQAGGNGHPNYVLAEDQPQPCPQCGQARVRGVNGSQRWCIGCGASWPTAPAFLAEVAAAQQPGSTAALRAALTARFTTLLPRLTPAQLAQLEAALTTLERQPTGD